MPIKKTFSLPPPAPAKRAPLSSTRPYLIDALIPAHAVHLIGGPSGAGKTRWLFDIIANWQKGNSIFGFASHPVPYVYVATDRDYASVCDTLRELGYDPLSIPIFPAYDREPPEGYSTRWLLDSVRAEFPDAKLLIIETVAAFVPGKGGINDYHIVGKFVRELGRSAKKRGLTILATTHTAKQKGNEKYDNPREQMLGSGGWGGFTETIFILNHVSSEDPKSPYRSLSVFPRNGSPNFVINYKFDGTGRLVPLAGGEMPPPPSRRGRPKQHIGDLMSHFIADIRTKDRQQFKLEEVLTALVGPNCSRRTVIRRIEELCDSGALVRETGGQYLIVDPLVGISPFEGVLM